MVEVNIYRENPSLEDQNPSFLSNVAWINHNKSIETQVLLVLLIVSPHEKSNQIGEISPRFPDPIETRDDLLRFLQKPCMAICTANPDTGSSVDLESPENAKNVHHRPSLIFFLSPNTGSFDHQRWEFKRLTIEHYIYDVYIYAPNPYIYIYISYIIIYRCIHRDLMA